MSDIKYMKLRTRNAKMMKMYGDKLTLVEKLINVRSNGLHAELQFSERYGGISVSATRADDCKCVRFKMIGYSHAYRWSTVYIPVTAEQEARIFADACRMADVNKDHETGMFIDVVHGDAKKFKGCYFGPNAIKYDTGAAAFSYISKLKIWKPSETKQICNETCMLLLMVVWPDITVVDDGYFKAKEQFSDAPQYIIDSYDNIPPHEQTPDQTEYLVRHYFETGTEIKEMKGN